MAIDETSRLARLQAAVDAIQADGGSEAAADAELILWLLGVVRNLRQRVAALEALQTRA